MPPPDEARCFLAWSVTPVGNESGFSEAWLGSDRRYSAYRGVTGAVAGQVLEGLDDVDAALPRGDRLAQGSSIPPVRRIVEDATDGASQALGAGLGREAGPRTTMDDAGCRIVLIAAHGETDQRNAGHQSAHRRAMSTMRDPDRGLPQQQLARGGPDPHPGLPDRGP